MIARSVDAYGIASIRFDTPGRDNNVFGWDLAAAFWEAVEAALRDDSVRALLIGSTKREFVSGADLHAMLGETDARRVFERVHELDVRLRTMERSGKPVAAALPGTALGAGLEIALACHYRVAADRPDARFGLPEVTLGLLPGAGGTQRLPRLIGYQAAVPLILQGTRLRASQAHAAGILNAVVAPGSEEAAARAWLLERLNEGKPVAQLWDVKGYKIPGGAVQSASGVQFFTVANAMLREKTYGNYPSAVAALSCVYEGLQTDIDTGLRVEARYFARAVTSPEAKNLIRLTFFGIRAANKLPARPRGVAVRGFKKVGVLGAGMMGAGIALATAKAGLDVVLLDVSPEAAQAGKERVAAGVKDEVLARIETTGDYGHLRGCDLVVEAVFEDRALKARVTRDAEAHLASDAIVASNTSTLPISGLARESGRPENFIGLHFFSPPERMPLVEIITGDATGDAALAGAMDYVRAIGKTPIVVKDSRGFYTSRVFGTYLTEGMAMLAEGVAPALIDNAGRIAGMPVGPLALTDEVSVELIYKINKQTRADLGATFVPPDAERVLVTMVETLDRVGKKSKRGFYDYRDDGSKRLWPDLTRHFAPAANQPEPGAVVERLIAIQSLEAARALQEGIVATPIDADVGALLGWGYPAFRGGPLGNVDTEGVEAFVARARRLAVQYGDRFAPPALLLDMAAAGRRFYEA